MKKRVQKNENRLWPILGGLAAQPLNQRLKRFLGNIIYYLYMEVPAPWNYQRKNTTTEVQDQLVVPTIDDDDFDNIIAFYGRWSVQYSETLDPLNMYLMTTCGFFCLNLPNASVAQALPSDKPVLSRELRGIYNAMYAKVSVPGIFFSADDEMKLKRFQLNCFLNMIFKDLHFIISKINHKTNPSIIEYNKVYENSGNNNNIMAREGTGIAPLFEIPACLAILIRAVSKSSNLDSLEKTLAKEYAEMKTNQSIKKEAKNFLLRWQDKCPKNRLFFNEEVPEVSKLADSAGRLGIIFHSVFFNVFEVFVEPCRRHDAGILSDVMLPGGQWIECYRIRYSLYLEDKP